MPKGFFLVIDGPDSVGKSTQTKLLQKRLTRLGKKVTLADFPRYGKPSAWGVEEYLKGKFGTAKDIGPYIPSVFFATDRFAASNALRQAIQKGNILISNRYVTANMAHQGGKIKNLKLRTAYYKWVNELEYNVFNLPKPNLHIFLHMPPSVSLQLMKKREGKRKDLHEKDLSHVKATEKSYLEIARKYKYKVIHSVVKGKLLTPQEIHEQIWQVMKSKLKV